MQGKKDLMNGTDGIKIEPGTSTQRLPSLKPPRDLSLSAFKSKLVQNSNQSNNKKKTYTPNLNVQRNRQRESAVVKQEPKETRSKINASERGRGRGRKVNLIQLNSGLFSEGLAPSLKSNRYSRSSAGGGDGPSEKSVLQKPKLIKQDNVKINKEEEDVMLKELLRDDFLDDPNLDPDYENCPIKLPLYESNLFSNNNIKKIKTEPGVDEDIDMQKCKGDFLPKIKIEPGLDEESQGDFVKKIKIELGLEDEIKGKLNEIKLNADIKKSLEDKKPKVPTVREIMDVKEPQYVLLQMPTCMPGLKPEGDVPTPAASSQVNGPSGSNNSNSSNNAVEQSTNNIVPESRCTLQTLKPGKIGKMQILKSGRVRLVLGETKLWLEMGTQVSFKQDLVSVDLNHNTKMGSTICMGSVPLRMTVTPDWEQMIKTQTVC